MHLIITDLWDISYIQCRFKFFRDDLTRELLADRISTAMHYMCDDKIIYMTRCSGYRVQQILVRWRDDGDSRLDLLAWHIRNVEDIFNVQFTQ